MKNKMKSRIVRQKYLGNRIRIVIESNRYSHNMMKKQIARLLDMKTDFKIVSMRKIKGD